MRGYPIRNAVSGRSGNFAGRRATWSSAPKSNYTLNWAPSPGNLVPPGHVMTRDCSGSYAPGTYFDSAGLLQNAIVNRVTGNYYMNGSGFSFYQATTHYTQRAFPGGHQTNNLMTRCQDVAALDVHLIYQSGIAITSGVSFKASLYLHRDTMVGPYVYVQCYNVGNTKNIGARVNLDDGTIASGAGTGTGTVYGGCSAEAVGGGVWRVTLWGSITDTSVTFACYSMDANGNAAYAGTGTGFVSAGWMLRDGSGPETEPWVLTQVATGATAVGGAPRGTHRWNGSAWALDGTIIEPAATTNALKRSNALGNVSWAATNTGSTSQNALGLDGTTSAFTSTDSDAANTYYKQATGMTLTAAPWVLSFHFDKTTGVQASYPVIWVYDNVAARIAAVTVDTSNGIATAWTSYTAITLLTGISARCVEVSATKWRVELVFTAAANSYQVNWAPACTANPTKSSGTVFDEPTLTGSCVLERGQLELGTAATSYVDNNTDTTTTRSADVATVPVSGLVTNSAGFASLKCRVINAPATGQLAFISSYDGSALGIPLYYSTLSSPRRLSAYDGTSVCEFGASALAPVAGDTLSIASSWGATAFVAAQNGGAGVASAAFDTNMNFGTNLRLGDHVGGVAAPVSFVLQGLRYGINPITAPELAAMTA